MDRSIPMFNRVVIQKMQKKHLDLHHKRLQQIKTNPRKQSHSVMRVQNPKGYQLQQQRRTQIEKQNIILFNKMTRIMNRNGLKLNSSHSQNRDSRLRDMNERIYEENRAIVSRISNQKPTISNRRLHEERQKHEKLLSFMGRYPYRSQHTQKQDSTFEELDHNGESQQDFVVEREHQPEEVFVKEVVKPRTSPIQERQHQKKSSNVIMPPIEGDKADSKRLIPLYKKRKDMEGVPMLVQVNRLYREYEFKLTNLASKKEYSLYLSEHEGNSMLTEYDYDYGYITSCFKLVGNKLAIELQEKPNRTQTNTQNRTINIPQPNNLYNENKLKNYRLKQEQLQQQAKKTQVRNTTQTNTKPTYQFQDLGTFQHSDTLEPIQKGFEQQVKIYYEQALDQQLQQV